MCDYSLHAVASRPAKVGSAEVAGRKAILGALALYLDFINLFMSLLQLFGQRREN